MCVSHCSDGLERRVIMVPSDEKKSDGKEDEKIVGKERL
jgi:hypothetical protein